MMATKQEQQPVAPADLSTQTGGAPTEEQEKKVKADFEALKIVAKAAPEPSIQLYMWMKKRLFHEKGMDDVWVTIAKAVGADQPPEGWVGDAGDLPTSTPVTRAQPIHNP
jgi:hypothetical protein